MLQKIFLRPPPKLATANPVSPKKTQEVIVMVGYPGSGKTTITKNIFEPAKYFIAHGDELKTSKK